MAEIDTVYLKPEDRFVVSLVIGYGNDDVTCGEEAVAAALALVTFEEPSPETLWHVHDRQTGDSRYILQEDVWELAKSL